MLGQPKLTLLKIKFDPVLAEVAGEKEKVEVSVAGEKVTVSDLIESLIKCYGQKLKKILIDPQTGKLYPSFMILVNGKEIKCLKNFDTELTKGDEIIIFKVVAGG
jgi:MoaD family protein